MKKLTFLLVLFFFLLIKHSCTTRTSDKKPEQKLKQAEAVDDSFLVSFKEGEFTYPFTLPALNYKTNALLPWMDKQTVEIHHGKHHKGYVNNLNNTVKDTEMEKLTLMDLMIDISKYPVEVRNNGGGHYNHTLYWSIMSPDGGGEPTGQLAEAITRDFGSFDLFKAAFEKEAKTHFASGWTWLVIDENNYLFVTSTPGHDNPLMDVAEKRGMPLLVIDVWEHAYYLKYQNRRSEFAENFWNLVNWNMVQERFKAQMIEWQD
ncbi:MAG: superoxide dismutase [bacterium]